MMHVIKGGLRRCCMLLRVETMLHVIKGGLRRCCMFLLSLRYYYLYRY